MTEINKHYHVLVEVAIPTDSDFSGARQAEKIRDFAAAFGDVVLFVDGFELQLNDEQALNQINAVLSGGDNWPGAGAMVSAIIRRTGRVRPGVAARGYQSEEERVTLVSATNGHVGGW